MWDLASDAAHDSTAPSVDEWRPRPAPGKVTRSERLTPHGRGAAPSVAPALQADRGALAGDDPFALHLIAQRGVATGASTLPHAAAIQTSFGHHDVSSVRAHVGGAAAEASAAIGAAAYATGDSVAFAASPDLRQAAHEAAHVVQQRGGVRLDGGLGQVGDPYEQHADAVADHVVRGESAEALLDTMAHRGASGGPAVQRLVAARDSSAIQIVQRLLADASAAEASALNTTMAEVALARHSEMEIRASVDFVHRGEVYRLLIPLLDVAHLALECSTAATAARSRPRTRGRRAGGARELTSLGRGPLAQLIRTLGGEVGEEQEVEATLRVPIPDTPACVTGVLAMQIAHSAEGYTVELSPQLGLGLLEGHNHADLLANSTIEVTGHSPEMAAELIAVALEHTLRNLGNQPPPPLVTAALVGAVAAAPEVTVPAVIAYALYRTGRYVVTGDGSDPIFPLVADAIFGANHMRTVRRAMTDGDSVETIDGMSVGGEAGAGEGHGRVEGGATLGAARHWSMEREDGHVEEAEWTSVDLEFTGEAHGFAAEVGIHLPMTRGAHVPGGEIEIELAAQAETESVETLVTLDVFARAIQLAVTALHDVAHAEEAITRLRAGSGAVGTLASGARSFIAARAVRGGATAQIGIVLALTFPLDGSEPCTLEVKITDGFEHEGAGQEIEYSHARSIGTVPFGGPAAHRAVSPDGGTTAAPEVVHAAAQRGLTGASGALPHAAAIQASFGHHDVGGIAAHVGGPVAEAADAIGARAYATGNAVAFAAAPDLRQAAHEAAHVVQQRGGVRLDGGVGRAGDPYEQHADAVADHVVRGASAEALLDTMAHRGASGGPAVQRLVAARDSSAIQIVQRLLADASAAEASALNTTLAEVALARHSEMEIRASVDFVHRGEVYRLLIPLLDVAHLALECSTAATAARSRPRTAARTAARAGAVDDLTLEQLAHRIAYLDGVAALRPEDRAQLTALGLDPARTRFHSGAGDLQFWVFPRLADALHPHTPVIAFRGTASADDLAEDGTPAGIGMGQFTMNQALIQRELQAIGAGVGVIATGHSLGGALAQIAACFYPDLIVSVVTFQAPGIPQAVLDRLRSRPAGEAPTAHHYRVDGCVVDDAGETFIPGDVSIFGEGSQPAHAHTTFPLLAEAGDHAPGWMATPDRAPDAAMDTVLGPAIDPEVGGHRRESSTSAPLAAQARTLAQGGIAETGRTHPVATATALGAGFGAAVGAVVAGGTTAWAGDELMADSARRDAYARIWTGDILPHAEAGDRVLLGQHIEFRCTEAGIPESITQMRVNYGEMFPELKAADAIVERLGASGTIPSQESFLDQVGSDTPLGSAARTRVERYWTTLQTADRSRAAHSMSGPHARPARDEASRARVAEMVERLSRGESARAPAPHPRERPMPERDPHSMMR